MLDRYGEMKVLYYTVCVVISLCSPYIRHQTPSMNKNTRIFQAASQCFAHNADSGPRSERQPVRVRSAEATPERMRAVI